MNWRRTHIGDLCDLVNGRAFKPSDWTKEGLKIVRIQNLNNPSKPFNRYNGEVKDKHIIESGDILLSWSGTPGTSFGCFQWHGGNAVLNQHIFKVLVDPKRILPLFFLHAVNSQLDEMIELAHGGVGLRHITKGKLESIEIPTPPLNEQQRIVTRIRDAMERVDELRRLRNKAEDEAKALFGSFLHRAETDAGTNMMTMDNILVDSRNGRSIKSLGDHGTGRILTLASVREPHLDVSKFKWVEMDDGVAKKYQVAIGDVFISRANTVEFVGLSAIAEAAVEDRVIYPDLMIRLCANDAIILPKYLMYTLRFPDTRKQIQERATGSSQSMVKISGKRLRSVEIPVPKLAVQQVLIERLDEAWRASTALCKEYGIDDSATFRAAILRKAFAGEL
jgi:type I restriction enzyme S subunit